MHRIDTPTAQKDKWGSGKNGFTDGDPTTGVKATSLNAALFDSVQEEICNVIEKNGITLDKSNNDQLFAAIQAMIDTSESELNLGTAAFHDVQESRDDITPGRVLVNGGALALRTVSASGEGGAYTDDCNNLPANSVSFCYASAANSPGYEATILDVGGLGGDGYRVQYAASYADGGKQLKFRTLNADNGYWGNWTTVLTNYGGTVDHLDGATYYQANPAVWMGAGGFAEQYGNYAPFHLPYGHITPKGVSQYLPLIKGVTSTEEYGFGSAVSFGISRSGNNDFGAAAIHIIGDNGLAAGYFFDTNGTFNAPGQIYSGGRIDAVGDITAGGSVYVGTAPTGGSLFVGGATYGNNGDINGSVWGGWLSSWLTNNVVHDIRLGAMGSQPTHDDWATSMVPAGCAQAGIHSNYNDSNWEVDTIYYWPVQKFVGGAWWNVGSGVGSRSADAIAPVDIPLPVVALTRFLNAQPYRDETTPDDTGGMSVEGVLVDYVCSNGYLWSQAQKLMSGDVFISYDSAGVIRHISDDATKLRLEGLSVAGLDSIPDECSIDGTWKFDGVTISRDSAIVNSKTLALNKERLVNRAIKASAAIAMIQASAAIGNPRAGDADNLLLAQHYLDELRDVDITQAEPVWPEVPDFMN